MPISDKTDVIQRLRRCVREVARKEKVISGTMTTALTCYSLVFMRFAWRVQPRNYLLFACHFTNATAQSLNDIRFVRYWHLGGREKKLGLLESEKPVPADKAAEIVETVKAVKEDSAKQ